MISKTSIRGFLKQKLSWIWEWYVSKKFVSLTVVSALSFFVLFPQYSLALNPNKTLVFRVDPGLIEVYRALEQKKTRVSWRLVTAYSSSIYQTDSTPFITASGVRVRDGIVAANFLPFGTKIQIPQLFGDKIFEVQDRMHPRNSHKVDIWFPSYWQAREFGVHWTPIVILN